MHSLSHLTLDTDVRQVHGTEIGAFTTRSRGGTLDTQPAAALEAAP